MKINGKKIIATGLTLVVVATGFSIGAKLKKQSPYEGATMTTTYTYSDETNKDVEDVTLDSNDVMEKYTSTNNLSNENTTKKYTYIDNEIKDNKTYDLMSYSKKLDEICSKKNYDKGVKETINSVVKKLYDNYDSMYEIYKRYGLPTKDEYISKFLTTIENNIDTIKFVDPNENSKSSQELDGSKGIFFFENKKILINSSYDEKQKEETIVHEIEHSTQKELYDNCRNLNYGIYKVFLEGEASNTSTLLYNTLQFNNKMYFCDNNIDYFLSGASSSSNALFSKYHHMLMTLTDYDTMQDYKKDMNEKKLIDKIEENYEIDGEKLFECIGECVNENINNYGSEKFVKSMCEIENIYLKCIKSDITKISSKEDALNLMNMYRHYKMQYSITCNAEEKNLDNEKFGIEDIEKELLNSAIEYQILPSGIEKETFDVLMFNVSPNAVGQETSITNIMYCNQDDKIIFTGKNSDESIEYNRDTNTIKECKNTKDIYNSSLPVIGNSSDKII